MAEKFTLEDLQKYKEFFESGDSYTEIAEKMGVSLESVVSAAEKIGVGFGSAKEKLGEFLGIGEVGVTALSDAYEKFNQKVRESSTIAPAAIQGLVVGQTALFPKITQGTTAFEEFGKVGAAASMSIRDSLGDAFTSLPEGIREMIRLQESAQEMRAGMYSLLQVSGSMGMAMREMGTGAEEAGIDMNQLNDTAAAMSERISEVGRRAQLTPKQVKEMMVEFGQMPGMLNDVSDAADGTGDSMDSMVKSVALARGLGMDYTQVIEKQKDAMFNWGTSIDQTSQNLVQMNTVAQELGINRDVFTKFLDDAVAGTNKLGDSTKSAILVMETLGRSLKDNGMGARGVGEMLSGSLQRMRDLDVGTAAFISQRSGGPGGLAGAFEMEALKQQGDEGVAQMLSKAADAFESMGIGGVVTLEDVGENEALAGELYRQTELLQKLGIAGDMTEATKYLQAMKDGSFDQLAEELAKPQTRQEEILAEQTQTLERGNQLASGMSNILLSIAQNQGAITRANALELQKTFNFADNNLDEVEGDGRGTGDRTNIEGLTGQATGVGAVKGINAMTGGTSDNMGTTTSDTLYQSVIAAAKDDVTDIGKGFANAILEGMGSAIEEFGMTPDMLKRAGAAAIESGRNTAGQTVQDVKNTLEGLLNIEIVLTDEERNLIVSRDMARRLEDLTKGMKVKTAPDPMTGAPRSQ